MKLAAKGNPTIIDAAKSVKPVVDEVVISSTFSKFTVMTPTWFR